MRILELITNHKHYWGVPHRRATDGCMVMTCYECGREHQVDANLRPADEPSYDRVAA